MKNIVCDLCKEIIILKEGELFNLEISKIIDGIEDYPHDPSRDYIFDIDLCKKCFTNTKKKIKELNKGEEK